MSLIEIKRLYNEWRTRLQRVQHVLQPPQWNEKDWKSFSRALYALIKKYGTTWSDSGINYWDVRWDVSDGGELICQVEEHDEGSQYSLVVAQSGGFAEGIEHYTWFYAEFDSEGRFQGDPYWVDGNWKDALAMILLPHQMAAGFYLTGSSTFTASNLLLEDSMPAVESYAQEVYEKTQVA